MTINITAELPIPFIQAAAHMPCRRRGRKMAASTLHRWATRGLHGVVLESLQVGGTKCTSMAALQRFFDRLSALEQGATEFPAKGQGQQERAEKAERELETLWSRTEQ
jgi:hypothetical protein